MMKYQILTNNESTLADIALSQNHGHSIGVEATDADLKACTNKIKAMVERLSA